MSRSASTVLCRANDVLGEGPIWDHRSDSLLWIDIERGRVHRWSDGVVSEVIRMDALIGSIALAGQADLLLATSKGLFRRNAASGEVRLLVNPIEGKPIRFNDGRVDAFGRLWVGTMAIDPEHYSEPWGELYRYDPDDTLHCMEDGLTISNGLDWSLDGKTFYLTDTMRRLIYAYDFDLGAGTIRNRRIFVQTAERDGYPDGLAVDRHENVWSVGFGGSVICCYDAQGQCIQKVSMPVSCPTALCFGGADHSTAFVTSSKHVLPPYHMEADAGALFAVELGAQGRPAAVFG